MTLHFRLTNLIPGLSSVLSNIAPKLLNFTTYPFMQGSVSRIEIERELNFRYVLQKESIDDWHRKILTLLIPTNDWNKYLVRVGSPHDGGYAIPVVVSHSSNWLCIGLGDNWHFESELVNNGNKVTSFDHTVVYRPKGMPSQIRWEKLGLGPANVGKLRTIDALLKISDVGQESQWCLKFDIEGAEWFTLKDISHSSNPPVVVTCELHNLLWIDDLDKKTLILRQLEAFLTLYEVVYIHGNNFSPCFITSEYTIFDAVEVTFVRKDSTMFAMKESALKNLGFPPNNPAAFDPVIRLNKELD